MLSAYVNRSCDIENAFILRRLGSWLIDVDFDLVELFLFNVAVQKQSSVVFVVVCNWAKLCLLFLRCLGQLFKVRNQVFKLWHLDELLNNVAGIEMPDGLYVLEDRFIVLLHLVELIRMVLWNFSYDIWREFGLVGDILCVNKKSLFQERVYLYIVFHLLQFTYHNLVVRVDGQIENRIIFNFYLQNLTMRSCPVACDSVLQIVNLELARSFFLGVLCTRSSWFEVYWYDVISEVADAFFLVFLYMVYRCLLGESKQSNQMSFLARIFLTSCDC